MKMRSRNINREPSFFISNFFPPLLPRGGGIRIRSCFFRGDQVERVEAKKKRRVEQRVG